MQASPCFQPSQFRGSVHQSSFQERGQEGDLPCHPGIEAEIHEYLSNFSHRSNPSRLLPLLSNFQKQVSTFSHALTPKERLKSLQ
ncbi:unnamed protein product [Calypogeia fissa]